MILNETYALSNSVKIPKLGLGTWMLTDSEAAQAVKDAVSTGSPHRPDRRPPATSTPRKPTATKPGSARGFAPAVWHATSCL